MAGETALTAPARLPSKVAAVTALFWAMKICAKTLGETADDEVAALARKEQPGSGRPGRVPGTLSGGTGGAGEWGAYPNPCPAREIGTPASQR